MPFTCGGKEKWPLTNMALERENPSDADVVVAEIARRKERAMKAVVATNAMISPEQFQALQSALGQEVVMAYRYQSYSVENDEDLDEEREESFILGDVGFVRDPRTQQLYLAFFRDENEHTYDYIHSPYRVVHSVIGDAFWWEMNIISSPGAWLSDLADGFTDVTTDQYIWRAVEDYSESMRALEKS